MHPHQKNVVGQSHESGIEMKGGGAVEFTNPTLLQGDTFHDSITHIRKSLKSMKIFGHYIYGTHSIIK